MPILYDKNISSIKPRVDSLNFDKLPDNTSAIFFTSGTTGEPTGALKSRDNITKELKVLKNLFAPYNFERVIVTVPLIHIYGFLAGVMLPKALGVDVVLKEEFLPHELIELAEGKKTLCITNPVFLKVLNKLKIEEQYPHITFLSSTGKLDADIAKSLNEKIGCTIYQLFGSTETGGIAYKVNDEELWRPLQGVDIAQKDNHLSVNSPYISEFLIESGLIKIEKPFITTDIIEIEDGCFRLLGRESEIIKISGKRISLLEVESLLEKSELIEEALVKLAYDVNSHKDEQLEMNIVSRVELMKLKKEVKRILQDNYRNINIRAIVKLVDKIKRNHMGKKLRI
nr:AMP-binding protein [Sulfurovum sp. bin170]